MEQLLTRKEAAKALGIGLSLLDEHWKSGELRYLNIGHGKKRKTPRFTAADLREFVEQRRVSECQSSSGPTPRTGRIPTGSKSVVVRFRETLAAPKRVKPKR